MTTCRIVDVDGSPVRVQGDLQTPEDHAAFAEVVRAARRMLAAEAGPLLWEGDQA